MAIPEFGAAAPAASSSKRSIGSAVASAATVEDMSLKQCQDLIRAMKEKVDATQDKKPKPREEELKSERPKEKAPDPPKVVKAQPPSLLTVSTKSRSLVLVNATTLREWLKESGLRRGVDLERYTDVLERAAWTFERLKHEKLTQEELARLGVDQAHRKALALCAQTLRHACAA
jgi:hypothetical protein